MSEFIGVYFDYYKNAKDYIKRNFDNGNIAKINKMDLIWEEKDGTKYIAVVGPSMEEMNKYMSMEFTDVIFRDLPASVDVKNFLYSKIRT